MIRHITVCFAFLALLLAAQEADESYNISKQTFPYIVIIRVKTMTEKSAKINNPVRWLPLSELIPDGTLVKKDQVIARFNTEYTQFDLDSQLLEEAVIDANLQRRLANIENNNIDMDDQMGELDDKLKTAEAKLARLNYRFLQSTQRYHLVEVELLTGRHHQIRCQLSHIGCCIKGDLKYGAPRSNPDGGICLHARTVEFIHPVKKEPISITCPLPSSWPSI